MPKRKRSFKHAKFRRVSKKPLVFSTSFETTHRFSGIEKLFVSHGAKNFYRKDPLDFLSSSLLQKNQNNQRGDLWRHQDILEKNLTMLKKAIKPSEMSSNDESFNKTGSSQVGAISKVQKYSKNNYWKHLEKLFFSKKIN